jgi:hypothetical protein
MAPLLPKVRGQFAEFLWRHSLEAWVCSTSPLASALVQSTMSPTPPFAARRRFQVGGGGAAWLLGRRPASTRPGLPIVHSAVAVDLGAGSCSVTKGTEQPLGLRPAGLTTRLHATHASINAADASSALPGGGELTARSATATMSPASSVSPLAPLHSRGAGWAQLV